MAIITIKDIAKELKLSPSTVSRALRDHPDISRPTKNRVISLAQKLDYHPDTIAQSLQTKKTKSIGVIVPEIKQPFFASVINGIEEVAYAAGYTIIVCQSNELLCVNQTKLSRGKSFIHGPSCHIASPVY